MGRYDFRPLRVYQRATQLLETPRLRSEPPWFPIIRAVPPAETLVRVQPVQHDGSRKQSRTKKPSKMFKPQQISYPEDSLRQEFFADHPWELARPRVVLELDGKDGHPRQSKRPINGESVVQRKLWLLNNVHGMTPDQAYDHARHEFYAVRHEEDVERRVAKEEALATGAHFGKTYLEIGMELEDKIFEAWKAWALKASAGERRAFDAVYTESDVDDAAVAGDVAPEETSGVLETAPVKEP